MDLFSYDEKIQLLKDIKDIKYILTGNGHPEDGLVFKVREMASWISGIKRFAWMLIAGAIGVPFTIFTAIYLSGHNIKLG